MKPFKFLPLLTFILLCFVSCSALGTPEISTEGKESCEELGSECVFGEWSEPTLTCTSGGVKKRTCVNCGNIEKVTLSPLGHDEITVEGRKSTCKVKGLTDGVSCSRCDSVITAQTELPLAEHTEETIPATENRTEGLRCSVCYEVLKEPEWIFADTIEDPSSYDSNNAYEYLSTLSKGIAMQKLYEDIDVAADAYHLGEKSLGENDSIIAVKFADYGLTRDEAVSVWAAYKSDRPLYYWIANGIVYNSTTIYITPAAEYTDRDTVLAINEDIYEAVRGYIMYADGATNSYEKALAFHDKIIASAYYAYEADGITPEDAVWAHNITGILLEGGGVCESYAKTFQLLLNYSKIDNAYATGVSQGENHAWNAAKMDDGKWYWFDLTWDDVPDYRWGVTHNYFCVTDSENVGYRDGYIVAASSFMQNHTLNEHGKLGMEFVYPVPERADEPYSSELFTREEIIEIDRASYKLAGYRTLSLIKAPTDVESFEIPENVAFGGVVYTVSYVCTNNGEDVFSDALMTLSVPKSVSFFHTPTPSALCEIFLDSENPHFELYNGAIYNENKTILYILCDKTAKTVCLISSLEKIYEPRFVFDAVTNLELFTVENENEVFLFEGGVLYDKESDALVWIPRKISGEVSLRSGVEAIGYNESDGAIFANCHSVTTITLPSTLRTIGAYAFAYCSSLSEIVYDGTRAEFEALIKSELWATGSSFTVRCNDETFTVG